MALLKDDLYREVLFDSLVIYRMVLLWACSAFAAQLVTMCDIISDSNQPQLHRTVIMQLAGNTAAANRDGGCCRH